VSKYYAVPEDGKHHVRVEARGLLGTGDTGALCLLQTMDYFAYATIPVTPPIDCPECGARAYRFGIKAVA